MSPHWRVRRGRPGGGSVVALGAATACAAVAGTLAAGTIGAGPAGAAGTARGSVYSSVAVSRTFGVDVRGNGHGHGLSQYGAEGAALAGLGYRRILAFYYPGTRLRTEAPSTIRVLVSHPGNAVTVAAQPGLRVSGFADPLPTAGITRYRLVAGSRRGVGLLALHGSSWQVVRYGLPATTRLRRHGPVRVYLGDGSSTAYRGAILAERRTARGATGLLTVNRVAIDDYVAGVVPREMPASWRPAAVRAQAVAARTYARYEADHSGGGAYDICDTSMCQVYGGAAHWSADGTLLWTEDQAAVTRDANQYLTYRGAAIFAQFSASDGGWTVDGGMPYLPGQQDPYDTSASGDPYVDYHVNVRSAQVADYFGLAKVTGIDIVRRDGHGSWGGRVVTARVIGTDSSGAAKTVTTDGSDLQWAFGLGSSWLRLTPDHAPRGQLGAVHIHRRALSVVGWAVDTDHAAVSPKVRVSLDGRTVAVFHTHVRRPRIVRHFALDYRRPGFHARYRSGAGRHRVCVTVLDSDGLRPTRLGCRRVRLRR